MFLFLGFILFFSFLFLFLIEILLSFFLDENLPPLDWKTRYKIVIGTARGLNYLHKDCQRRIIHRDIKSSNVLLTSEFEPLVGNPIECSHIRFFLVSFFLRGEQMCHASWNVMNLIL